MTESTPTRAEVVLAAWQRHVAQTPETPYVRGTAYGAVSITAMTGESRAVNVWTGGDPDLDPPTFRVTEPPLQVGTGDAAREDPLAALAEIIGQHGGASVVRRGRRSRG